MFGKQETKADLIVYTIYDSASESYGMPMMASSNLAIIREYENQWPDMLKSKSMLASHSEQYQLFKIGSFTQRDGKLKTCEPTHVIGFHEIRTSAMSRYGTPQIKPETSAGYDGHAL